MKAINPAAIFRCPFEIKAEKEGNILQVTLGDDRVQRLDLIRKGFETFHSDMKFASLHFILPNSLLEQCDSNQSLKPILVPYQMDCVTAELDYRLNPCMYYQIRRYQKEEFQNLIPTIQKESPYKMVIATILLNMMNEFEFKPANMLEVSYWIEMVSRTMALDNGDLPMLNLIGDGRNGSRIPYATFGINGVKFFPEQSPDGADRTKNKNCFYMVRTPFYPKAFGRYSENIEIVFTWEADFLAVPIPSRCKIRAASNEVLAAYGVEIPDLENGQQPEGLWAVDFPKEMLEPIKVFS